jgi:flagellin-like protein
MKQIWANKEGVSPVIGVILMVAITVVLVSVLYVLVNGFAQQMNSTPRGALIFIEDDTIDGKYRGGFQGSVKLESIEIKVVDSSGEGSVNFNPNEETFRQIPGGLNITLSDVNQDSYLDGSDILLIQDGDLGDEVSIIYKLNYEIIGAATLN